ncbi:MAG: hypothetical protein N3B21_18620 [Clostridia bacterium]|nr:hypothetical protein [Clostridia bacterium]
MNFWLYVFLISVSVFLLLINWRDLTRNIWAGFVCITHQLSAHILAYKLGYWNYFGVNEGLPNLIVFSNFINIFFLGSAFLMGILFVQFLPKNYFLQLIHSSVWTFFFRLLYYIAEQNGMVQFLHWRTWMYFYIIPVNMLTLAWIKNIFERNANKNEDVNRNSA